MEPTTRDDDIGRQFRENDSVGDSSSFWYRATRQFYESQSPVGAMRMLTTGPSNDDQLPLGLFTYTNKNRLIYWPALAKGRQAVETDGTRLEVFDHITLEFPSEKMHLTYINECGETQRLSREARACRLDGSDLAICFEVLVKIDVLNDQDMGIQRKVNIEPTHRPRMFEWLTSFAVR